MVMVTGAVAIVTAVEDNGRCEPVEDERTASPDLLTAPDLLEVNGGCTMISAGSRTTAPMGHTMFLLEGHVAAVSPEFFTSSIVRTVD
nr:hypothetical protein Itr_chr11CG14380 [Ipomoea trifida]